MPRARDALLLDWASFTTPALVEHLFENSAWQPSPLPAADWTGEILRPDDLLVLVVSAYNLRPDFSSGQAHLRRIVPQQPTLLVFELPAQAIAEQAFFASSTTNPLERPLEPSAPPPAKQQEDDLAPGEVARARTARPSRLVFRVPNEVASVPLSIEGLLDWDAFEPVLTPLAALSPQPTADEQRTAPDIAEPTPLQTALEMPYRLVLSPNDRARWSHARAPVSTHGRTELWHTRIGNLDDEGGRQEASSLNTVPLRAIWSPDYDRTSAPDKKAEDPGLGVSAMNPNDRHQIVALTSAYADYQRHSVPPVRPTPIEASQLMLSSLGGWLRSSGHWNLPESTDGHVRPWDGIRLQRELSLPVARAIPLTEGLFELTAEAQVFVRPPTDQFDLTEWVHVATQGRDHYVRLVYDGCLFPLGHRASLIKVTERRFEEIDGAPVALLRQFVYVVVRQQERDYPRGRYPHKGREMPLTRIRMRTLVTPHLMKPDDPPAILPGTDYSFWMLDNITGRDVPFEMLGFDGSGREVPFTMPLVFVRRGESRMDIVRSQWRTAPQPGGSEPRRRAVVNGVDMDFAPGSAARNTVLPARSLYFDVHGDGGCGGYHPVLFKADVTLASVEQLVGRGATTTIAYFDGYLNAGFDASVGLFARIEKDVSENLAAGALGLQFSAEQAGGIATPNAQLTGLSAKLGPLAGDLADAVADKFDPKRFFGSLPAGQASLLFGAFSLGDILPVGSLNSLAPSIDTRLENGGTRTVTRYQWTTTPVKWPAGGGIVTFLPNADSNLKIDARVETVLDGGASQATMSGKITSFRIEFFNAVTLGFDAFSFTSSSNEKLDVNVALNPVEPIRFGGDLDFVRKLSELIPPGVFGDGPSIDIRPDSATLGFDIGLPPMTVGVFALKNLGLNAGLQLPFRDGRPLLDFGFARRQSPFLLTVSLLGGGGFFHLQLDTGGLRVVEAALEFGASADLNIGVASGNVHVFAGIYFKLEKRDGELQVVLAGYLRMGGALSVLGIVTISVEFNLSFTYDSGTAKVTGRATLTVCVEVACFSKAVELSVERSFGRDGGDPAFGDLVHTPAVWTEYTEAFA